MKPVLKATSCTSRIHSKKSNEYPPMDDFFTAIRLLPLLVINLNGAFILARCDGSAWADASIRNNCHVT